MKVWANIPDLAPSVQRGCFLYFNELTILKEGVKMKRAITSKIFYLTIILLFTSVAFSEPEWITFPGGSGTPGEPPVITITHNDLDYTEYTVDIPGMWREEFEAPIGITFDTINIPDYGHTLDVGLPRIPVMRDLFAVPHDCSDIVIQTSDVQSVILDNYYIYPSQQPYSYSEEPPPFEYDENFYNSDVWYPLEGLAISDMPGELREIEVRDMNMSAIKFNPYQRQLEIKYHFKVTMTYYNSGGWVPEPRPSGDFYQMYPYLITNLQGISGFGDFGKEGASGQYIYMIICDSRFDNDMEFREVMEQFYIFLRDYRGFDVVVKSTTDIGGNDAYYIWDFLKKYFYDHRNLEYVLLVGDTPQYENDPYGIPMPEWTLYFDIKNNARPPSDMGYARLTPLKEMNPIRTDTYPDITVGRMVVDSADEFENIIYKTTQYYYTDNENYSWEKRCLLCSHKEPPFGDAGEGSHPIEHGHFTKLKKYELFNYPDYYKQPYFYHCFAEEEPNATNETVKNYINNTGFSIVNYFGHGDLDAWYQWDHYGVNWDETWVSKLNNVALPVVFQFACRNGRIDIFGEPDCLCEYWLNSEYGAVAVCGGTRDMLRNPYTRMTDFYWFKCIYGDTSFPPFVPRFPIRSFGTVVYTGITKWVSVYYSPNNYSYEYDINFNSPVDTNCWPDSIQIYGDPSLLMRSGVDWTLSLSSSTTNKEPLNITPLTIEKIYPCPANDYINCVLSIPYASNVNISIYDISGRLVYKTVITIDKPGLFETNIDTKGLTDGVYILNASSGIEKTISRFVVVR